MSFLLMLPLAIFAAVILLVGAVIASVEIAEQRRARPRSRRLFRPVVIEGGKGNIVEIAHRRTVSEAVPPDSKPVRLVR